MKPLFISAPLACFYTSIPRPARLRVKLLFTSRLKKPKKFRLICFRPSPSYNYPASSSGPPRCIIHRLCGLPGDVLEIRAGILYVNGVNADKDLILTHIFKVPQKDSFNIRYDPKSAYIIPPYPDTLYLSLEDNYVRERQLPCERYLLPPGLRDEAIFRIYKRNWNQDNFGPVKVPAGHWFVLGDNRGNALDSRHLGFIDQSTYIGTLL